MTEPDATKVDLAIIGGGINGAAIARDAAGRGARVILFERGDLASGTSSASTKLIHGGLRYLEHGELALVREALAERERLFGLAPHLIQPLRLVLPLAGSRRPGWMIRAGLFLYDRLGGRSRLARSRAVELAQHPAGPALKAGGRAFDYGDGWCDDSRLVIANARDAAMRGARVLTGHEVTEARREGAGWVIAAGGRRFRAAALVNAAGPQLETVTGRIEGAGVAPALRLVRGSHLVLPALFDHGFGYFFMLEDGRIIFVLPFAERFTLVGTTEVDSADDGPPEPSAVEIDYLLAAVNARFRRQVGRGDVVHAFAGLRPLVADHHGRPDAVSRGYRLELSAAEEGAALLEVLGGKVTTHRALAEEAVDLLAPRLEALAGGRWTGEAPLPGGALGAGGLEELEAGLAREFPFLEAGGVRRIARAYGSEARRWLGQAADWAALGGEIGAGLSHAELRWMMDEEFARQPDDVLWRRSKLGLVMDDAGRERLGRAMEREAAAWGQT